MEAGQRVLICEGERDANTAVALGYASTTAPGGAKKWYSEYDEFFRNADVVVVSDSDPQARDKETGELQFHPDGRPMHVGQDHAANVAKRLRKVAAHVRTIIFPQHKDLSEWKDAGGTRAALDALIEAAPDLIKQPPPPGPDGDDAEIERLARMTPIAYARARESAAEQLGISSVASLDKLVEAKRRALRRDRPLPPAAEATLAELNADHATVVIGARTRVLRFEDTLHFAGGERYVYRLPNYLKFEDFRNYYLNRYCIDDNGEPFAVDMFGNPLHIGHWWLDHPARRTYHGVTFLPGGEPVIDDWLNLWTGFGVRPRKGEWGRMKEHIFEVLAAGDDAFNAYIYNWLADAVQHPDRQAEVALAFFGGLGTGRGLLGRSMCRIFGQHGRHISSSDHLTGKFNAHMQMCCFLFADEAVVPQDRKAEGVLKRTISDDTLFIEPKGIDPFEVPNRLHVMLASNHEWFFLASEKERRYVAQNVAETHQQEEAWFTPIYEQMRNGGLEAMLYDLLDHNLGDWRPRKIVRTAALAQQQEESLSPLDQWWLELLQTGVLKGARGPYPNEAVSSGYEEKVVVFKDGYGVEHTQTVRREGLYDQARRISPKLKGMSDTALGRYLRDPERGCINTWVKRDRGWRFPTLADCRDKWCARFPDTVWADPSPADWTFGEDDT